MRPECPPDGKCPQGKTDLPCNLQCKYNHFEADDLTIDSWELKCLDCGYRSTIAYRSDEPETLEDCDNPKVCPFCAGTDLPTGRDPCQKPN